MFLTIHCAVSGTRLIWVCALAALTGVTGAAFWICREEGAWLAPAALIVVVGLPLLAVTGRNRSRCLSRPLGREILRRVIPVGMAVAVIAATCVASIGLVAARNESSYGVNLTSDFASGGFPRAYAAWSRIRGTPTETLALQQYVPINVTQREAAAGVSAAARELQPVLTDPAFVASANGSGCVTLHVCDDFAGGWTPWAIREAARLVGHADTEQEFQAFFGRVADEINAACGDGRLTCAADLPAAAQPFLRAQAGATLQSALYWLGQLPVNSDYYAWSFDDQEPFPLSATDRAILQQGVTGVPATWTPEP